MDHAPSYTIDKFIFDVDPAKRYEYLSGFNKMFDRNRIDTNL